jgi:hypothetical protein
MGDFNIPFLQQKGHPEGKKINKTLKMDLTDIYKVFHPAVA